MKKESERLSQEINQRDTNKLGKLDFHVHVPSFKKLLNTNLNYVIFCSIWIVDWNKNSCKLFISLFFNSCYSIPILISDLS